MVQPNPNCTGVKGTSQSKVRCNFDRTDNVRTLTFTDAVVSTDLMPLLIQINISTIKNPADNIVTDSLRLWTLDS